MDPARRIGETLHAMGTDVPKYRRTREFQPPGKRFCCARTMADSINVGIHTPAYEFISVWTAIVADEYVTHLYDTD
jgi:hypothetical protein